MLPVPPANLKFPDSALISDPDSGCEGLTGTASNRYDATIRRQSATGWSFNGTWSCTVNFNFSFSFPTYEFIQSRPNSAASHATDTSPDGARVGPDRDLVQTAVRQELELQGRSAGTHRDLCDLVWNDYAC